MPPIDPNNAPPARLIGSRPHPPKHSTLFHVLIAQALLWLAASVASALIVYWLYVSPAYGTHWTALPGAVVFAGLCLYAGAGCARSLVEAFSRRPPRADAITSSVLARRTKRVEGPSLRAIGELPSNTSSDGKEG